MVRFGLVLQGILGGAKRNATPPTKCAEQRTRVIGKADAELAE